MLLSILETNLLFLLMYSIYKGKGLNNLKENTDRIPSIAHRVRQAEKEKKEANQS